MRIKDIIKVLEKMDPNERLYLETNDASGYHRVTGIRSLDKKVVLTPSLQRERYTRGEMDEDQKAFWGK